MTLNEFFKGFKDNSLYLITIAGAVIAVIAFGLNFYSNLYFQIPNQILMVTNQVTNQNKKIDDLEAKFDKRVSDLSIKTEAQFAAQDNSMNEAFKQINDLNATVRAIDVKVEQRVLPRLRQQGAFELNFEEFNTDDANNIDNAAISRRPIPQSSSPSSVQVSSSLNSPTSANVSIPASSVPSVSNEGNLREFLRQEIRIAIREALQLQPCISNNSQANSDQQTVRDRLRDRLDNTSSDAQMIDRNNNARERLQERRELVRTGGVTTQTNLLLIIAIFLILSSVIFLMKLIKGKVQVE